MADKFKSFGWEIRELLGSRKNKFAILGVEAPDRQGVKTLEYRSYFEFMQRSQVGCIGA